MATARWVASEPIPIRILKPSTDAETETDAEPETDAGTETDADSDDGTMPESRLVVLYIFDLRRALGRPIPASSPLGGSSVNSASSSALMIIAFAQLGG